MTINWVDFFPLKIAVANAGEARKWMEAFDHAKQQVQENQLECCDFHSTNYKIMGGFWEKKLNLFGGPCDI